MMRLHKTKKGAISIIVAISMVVLLLFAALVIDIGMIAVNKSKLQNACDAAALAGAQELPFDTTKAEAMARQYAAENGVEDKYIGVSFSDSNSKITVTAENKPVEFFFAKVVGISEGEVSAKASAINAPISKYGTGLRPFGVEESEVKPFITGKIVILKVGADENYKGNFGPVALNDKSGASVYQDSIINGSNKRHYVGEKIPTETGNMVQATLKGVQELLDGCNHTPLCTSTNYNSDCTRIITVPLVNTMEVAGCKEITITGFAKFFLEEVVKKKGNNGHIEIKGVFMEEIDAGGIDTSQPDYGLRGVKLVE